MSRSPWRLALPLILLLPGLASLSSRATAQCTGFSTGYYHTQQIGNSWYLIDPSGACIFMRGMSITEPEMDNWAAAGDHKSYDAVYLANGLAGSNFSANLSTQAESGIPYNQDVVHPVTGVTVKNAGDQIYMGWKLPVTASYFWLDQLGVGGAIDWYYSTASGWKKINSSISGMSGKAYSGYSNENPYNRYHLNSDSSYYLDVGTATAPEQDGTDQPDPDWTQRPNPPADNANVIHWWDINDTGGGLATDFAPVALTSLDGHDLINGTTLFYIMGKVTRSFTTPPVVNRLFEREWDFDMIMRKYGFGIVYGGYYGPAESAYNYSIAALKDRLTNYGVNAEGGYSSGLTGLPGVVQWQLSLQAYLPQNAHLHDLWQPPVCPPNSGHHVAWYASRSIDVFSPAAPTAFYNEAHTYYQNLGSDWRTKYYGIIAEEADNMVAYLKNQLFLGFMVIQQNPYNPTDSESPPHPYTDPLVYAKFALRDFLRNKYKDTDDPISPPQPSDNFPLYSYARNPSGHELSALNQLNTAWGTHYLTWDTSAGDISQGTNAYGTGSGFMDEDATHILNDLGNSCYHIQNNDEVGIKPNIEPDLDNFAIFYVARYAYLVNYAVSQQAHPPIEMPLYGATTWALRTMAPSVDIFWVNNDHDSILAQYNATHKPVIYADYSVADVDSAENFGGRVKFIEIVPVDGVGLVNRVHIDVANGGVPYNLSSFTFVAYDQRTRDCLRGQYLLGSYLWPSGFGWDYIDIPVSYQGQGYYGDETSCVNSNSSIGPDNAGFSDQPSRAQGMINRWNSVVSSFGDDHSHFVVGFDHWALRDDAVTKREYGNYGILTVADNFYDDVEAGPAVTAKTYPDVPGSVLVGGEDRQYGNLLTKQVVTDAGNLSLVQYFQSFDNLQSNGPPAPPSTPNGLVVTTATVTSVGLQWTANPPWDNVTSYTVYSATFSMIYFPSQDIRTNPSIRRTSVTNGTSATVDNLLPATWYYFRLTATNTGGESDFSSEASTSTVSGAPGSLPAPTLNLPPFITQNAQISAGYNGTDPAAYYQWTFTPQQLTGQLRKGGSQDLGQQFRTQSPIADLASQNLALGPYTVTVQVFDNSGLGSPVTQGQTTIVRSDLAGAREYPNPWRSDRGYPKQINFDNLTVDTSIKIFTLSGHLVKTLPTVSTAVSWDLTNDSGDTVASGTYLYVMKTASGEKVTGKLAIIK